jgi:YD repeat-containing protein
MNKYCFLLFLIVAFSIQASAQTTDFPIGFSGVPRPKLKGAVHTLLTIEQRGEKVFSTVVETYDLNGKLIESISSNAGIEFHSGTMVRLGGKTFYTYDASGRLIKERTFTTEGRYTGYETYIYDSQNRLIETRLYDVADKETGKRTYTYFPEKREVLATWNFYYEGRTPPPSKNLLSYNEKEQWTKRTEFESNGTPSRFITFEYDAQGNFVKETHCCKYNYTHRYNYKFDKQGNWIERQNTYSYLDDKGEEKVDPNWMHTYRVITYYSDNETKP